MQGCTHATKHDLMRNQGFLIPSYGTARRKFYKNRGSTGSCTLAQPAPSTSSRKILGTAGNTTLCIVNSLIGLHGESASSRACHAFSAGCHPNRELPLLPILSEHFRRIRTHPTAEGPPPFQDEVSNDISGYELFFSHFAFLGQPCFLSYYS